MSLYLDRDDPHRTYAEIRVALPMSLKQRRARRRWRKFMASLPPNTNVTTIFSADVFRITKP